MDGQKKIEILKYLYDSIVLPMVLKMIEVIMKSKMTLLTFLVHITSLVVNTVQVNTPGGKNYLPL